LGGYGISLHSPTTQTIYALLFDKMSRLEFNYTINCDPNATMYFYSILKIIWVFRAHAIAFLNNETIIVAWIKSNTNATLLYQTFQSDGSPILHAPISLEETTVTMYYWGTNTVDLKILLNSSFVVA